MPPTDETGERSFNTLKMNYLEIETARQNKETFPCNHCGLLLYVIDISQSG